jgi:RHS repeat-associated protein
MFRASFRKIGITVVAILFSLFSSAQNYPLWEHPVLKALDAKDSSYAGFGTYNELYIGTMALHRRSNTLYYFTRYGALYDSISVDTATALLLIEKKLQPLDIYRQRLTDRIDAIDALRHALRQKRPDSVFHLTKIIPLEQERSDLLAGLFEVSQRMDLSFSPAKETAAIVTPFGTMQVYKDSLVFYNSNEWVAVYKAVADKKRRALRWITRSGRVLNSMPMNDRLWQRLKLGRAEPFVLLRFGLEARRAALAKELRQLAKAAAVKKETAQQLDAKLVKLGNDLFALTVPDSAVLLQRFAHRMYEWEERYEVRRWASLIGFVRYGRTYGGRKRYELTNHLGNVQVVISDKRRGVGLQPGDSLVDHFVADVLRVEDYYPFGMGMPGRRTNADTTGYRYGFNGKEDDRETGWQDYGMRVYRPGLGRFLSVDPIGKSFPWNSVYSFAEGDPINYVDIDGMERGVVPVTSRAVPLIPQQIQLSNLRVGSNGAISNSTQLFGSGGVNSGTYAPQLRLVTQEELNAMIPPNAGASLNPDGKSMTVYNSHGSWQVSLLKPVEQRKELTWVDRVVAAHELEKLKQFTFTKWNETIKAYEKITTNPANLDDDYLAGVNRRLINGTATAQDKLYASEVAARKTAGKIKDPDTIEFIQGKDANAKKMKVDVPDGYKKTKIKSHGQSVFTNGKSWITPDKDGHNGGVWKMYDKEENVGKAKEFRIGTYDANLNRIGE